AIRLHHRGAAGSGLGPPSALAAAVLRRGFGSLVALQRRPSLVRAGAVLPHIGDAAPPARTSRPAPAGNLLLRPCQDPGMAGPRDRSRDLDRRTSVEAHCRGTGRIQLRAPVVSCPKVGSFMFTLVRVIVADR